jgi:hypothetical protein
VLRNEEKDFKTINLLPRREILAIWTFNLYTEYASVIVVDK